MWDKWSKKNDPCQFTKGICKRHKPHNLIEKVYSVGFSATQLLSFLVWAVALFTSFQVSTKKKFSNVGNTNCGVAQKSRGFPYWGTSTLHKKKSFRFVNYSILKQNYRTCLKMKIVSYVYCRNKLVSHKKFSKVALQTSFLWIHVFLHNKKSISLSFQSDRLIPPVPHISTIKVTRIKQFFLI